MFIHVRLLHFHRKQGLKKIQIEGTVAGGAQGMLIPCSALVEQQAMISHWPPSQQPLIFFSDYSRQGGKKITTTNPRKCRPLPLPLWVSTADATVQTVHLRPLQDYLPGHFPAAMWNRNSHNSSGKSAKCSKRRCSSGSPASPRFLAGALYLTPLPLQRSVYSCWTLLCCLSSRPCQGASESLDVLYFHQVKILLSRL